MLRKEMNAERFILVFAAALAIEARGAQELELARKAVEDGFFDYAARVLERAPDSEERSLLLGVCQLNLRGKLKDALKLLKGRLGGPFKTEALYWISVARLSMAQRETDEAKAARLYEEAARGFAEASSALSDPEKRYKARHSRARALLGLRRFEEGVSELRRCLERERRPDAESDLISALYQARLYREAAAAAESFAKAWPDEQELAGCLLTGAQSYYLQGDWPRAEELYRAAMEKSRYELSREEARYGLAWALWKKASGSSGQERAEALEECAGHLNALTASSSPMRARVSRYRLACVLHELGRDDEAIGRLSGLVRSEDLGAWAQSLAGKAYLELGDFTRARDSFLRVLVAARAAGPGGPEPPRSLQLEAHDGIADSYMREGRKKKKEGRKVEAGRSFAQAFAAYGKMAAVFGRDALARARARYGQARAALEAGDYESAAGILSSMASAREIPPGMRLSALHLERGRLYREWALRGDETQRPARLEDASRALAKAIEMEDRQELSLPALIERARVEVDFAALDPGRARAHLSAAAALLREALSFAGAPRELEAEARRELGNCLLLQDRPQRARLEFEAACRLIQEPSSMLGRARALARTDSVRAEQAYGDLLASFPSPHALFELGKLRRKMGRALDASRDLEAVARLYPRFEKRAEAWLLAAEAAREAGQLHRAAELYDECRPFVGKRAAETRLKRAEILLEMGRAEDAARLSRGLGAFGALVEGLALERLKRRHAALASLRKAATARDPRAASTARLAAGRILLRLGEWERARDSFLSAVYLVPEDERRSVAEEALREVQRLAPRGRIAKLTEDLRKAGGM